MDQTAELNARLASEGPVVDLGGETFTCDWPVIIPVGVEALHATIVRPTDGSGLTRPPGSKQSWRQTIYHVVVGGRAIDFHIQGPGAGYDPATEEQHGFKLGDGAYVGESTVHDVLGDGASLGESSDCTISGLDVDGCGRQGMSWVKGDNGLIEDCSFTRVARTVIDLEPMATLSQVINGFVARRITVGTYQNRVVGSGGSGDVHDVLIEDLTMLDGWLAMDIGSNGERTDFTFRRCVGTKVKNLSAFTFHTTDGVLIEACSQNFGGKVPPAAVRAIDCTDVVLAGCSWPGASAPLSTV